MNKGEKNMHFYSNAKLMLTGEYLVLKGAVSLALPLVKGQELKVLYSEKRPYLSWRTYVMGDYWFEANYSLPDLAIANTNDFPIAQNIRDILIQARTLNKDFLNPDIHIEVTSKINFDINWGLGSSSSLIVNIAKWANINPFDLHFRVSEGSGYDVAAALSDHPVIYQIINDTPKYTEVEFCPPFHDKIYFAYLGKKRNSAEAVANFNKLDTNLDREVEEISVITQKIVSSTNQVDFINFLKRHDKIISRLLSIKPLHANRFHDFNGYAKSLGAWGGDFAMFISDLPKEYVLTYFRKKELKHYFPYKEIIKYVNPGINV
jgi:mevalonate kinase